jgi:hypothetical protein
MVKFFGMINWERLKPFVPGGRKASAAAQRRTTLLRHRIDFWKSRKLATFKGSACRAVGDLAVRALVSALRPEPAQLEGK